MSFFTQDCYFQMFLLILEGKQAVDVFQVAFKSIQLFYFLRIKVQIYDFSSFCDMPHLAAENKGDFFYRRLEPSS